MSTLSSRKPAPSPAGPVLEMSLDAFVPSATFRFPNGMALTVKGPVRSIKQQCFAIAFTLVQTGIWQEIPAELLT